MQAQALTLVRNGLITTITVEFAAAVTTGIQQIGVCRQLATGPSCQAFLQAHFEGELLVTQVGFSDAQAMTVSIHLDQQIGQIGSTPVTGTSFEFSCSTILLDASLELVGGTLAECRMAGQKIIEITVLHTYDNNGEPRIKSNPRSSLTFIAGAITGISGLSSTVAQTLAIQLPPAEEMAGPQGVAIGAASSVSM